MIKSKPCKLCGSIYHTASFCRDKKVLKAKKLLNPKVKKLSRSKIKKELDKLVKDYVKERDNYTCQHCGAKVTGSNCHASHIYPVGSCSLLQFEPLNMKVLCYHCHINWWHKNPIEADEWIKSKFPDRVAILDVMKTVKTKTSTVELKELVDGYKNLKRNA